MASSSPITGRWKVLINSSLSGIPPYTMQRIHFLLEKYLEYNPQDSQTSPISWDKKCRSNERGDWVLGKLKTSTHLFWQNQDGKSLIIVTILGLKYINSESFLETKKPQGFYYWKSVLDRGCLIKMGLCWTFGDGKRISF